MAIGQNIWKARQSNHYLDVHAGAAAAAAAEDAAAEAAAAAAFAALAAAVVAAHKGKTQFN